MFRIQVSGSFLKKNGCAVLLHLLGSQPFSISSIVSIAVKLSGESWGSLEKPLTTKATKVH